MSQYDQSHFVCKQGPYFQLQSNKSKFRFLDTKVCFCGSVVCMTKQYIFRYQSGHNNWQTFYTDLNDAFLPWIPPSQQYQKSIFWIPAHGQRTKGNNFRGYCAVCRTDYKDYLEHIESTVHNQRKERQTDSSKYIKQLCTKFSKIKKESPSYSLRNQKGRFSKKIKTYIRNNTDGRFVSQNRRK